MKIKYISFDFWNTLFEGTGPDHNLRENERIKLIKIHLKNNGYNVTEKELINVFKDTWKYFVNVWENKQRTLRTKEILNYIFDKLDIDSDIKIDSLIREISELLLKYPPSLTEDIVYDLIPKLSKKYELYIISDTALTSGKYLRKLLKTKNLLKYFDNFSFSDEIGRSKPHKNMFLNVLNDITEARYLLHIGDIGRTDVLGANKINANSIRYNGYNEEPLKNCKADFVMNSWNNFPQILNELKNK